MTTKRLVLVKVEYHGQVWYITQEIITMGKTHATTNRTEVPYPRQAPQRHQPEADSV